MELKEWRRAQLQGIEIEKKQLSSGFAETPEVSVREQPASSIQTPLGVEKGLLISEVIDRFADEAKTNWRDKTKGENFAILRFFLRVVGDVPIQSVTRKTVSEFKQTLMQLPPNINKNPKYRRKTIPEIVKMDKPRKMSGTTIAKYLIRVGALFEYARRNGLYEGANPATGMNPPKDKRPHEARAPFTKEDLIKLFHSEDYLNDRHKETYQFWMPILALFTGARLNELAQLHVSDIRQTEDGVWVFDINEEAEKKLKATASKRIIPIHPFLLKDLNFLSWVKELQAKRKDRLFPQLKKGRDGYGRNVSLTTLPYPTAADTPASSDQLVG